MKQVKDLRVVAAEQVSPRCTLLRLTDDKGPLPDIAPGQFAEVRVDGSAHVLLRRPLSVHYVDRAANELWLLIQAVGEGTRALCALRRGQVLNALLPLGRGFSQDVSPGDRLLLCGGGIGVAPLLYYGAWLTAHGAQPTFLLGARSADELLQVDRFSAFGLVCLTTDDGSAGVHGLVTQHPVLRPGAFRRISVCGPMPMMRAMAQVARRLGTPCEVSLENRMACGLGACLCCVQQTRHGNVCVCTEGPVFNIDELDW